MKMRDLCANKREIKYKKEERAHTVGREVDRKEEEKRRRRREEKRRGREEKKKSQKGMEF